MFWKCFHSLPTFAANLKHIFPFFLVIQNSNNEINCALSFAIFIYFPLLLTFAWKILKFISAALPIRRLLCDVKNLKNESEFLRPVPWCSFSCSTSSKCEWVKRENKIEYLNQTVMLMFTFLTVRAAPFFAKCPFYVINASFYFLKKKKKIQLLLSFSLDEMVKFCNFFFI